ncbi:MAG: LPS assembly protein LptD [Holosporaceae bacterium]|nr:LPS assembly protein LptD [Holosporaceae bacterium]
MKFFFIFMMFLFSCAFGEEIVFINSDSTQYTNNMINCRGNVIIVYNNRIISADVISYDKKTEVIHASGNVIIKDEKQNVYFLDSLSVDRNFSSGEGKNVKIIMQDQSRLAAEKCSIKNGKYELENAVYTSCYECANSGELTWQVKALHVTFDPKEDAEYQNAKFELLGTPILYTPYLSHASSNLKRKSGFLVPKFSASSIGGFSLLPQYLWSISDSQELILKPIITSKIGNVGWLYYGLRFPNGEFNIDASLAGIQSAKSQIGNTDSDKKAIRKIQDSGYRGHVFSKMKYEINDVWRCGFDVNLASDRYYLKKFPFLTSVDRGLESNVKLEGFDGRNYTSVKTAMLQSIDSECMPRILPVMERNYSTDLLYGTFSLDSYFANLDFNNHRSAQKFVSDASWRKEILLPFGHLVDLKGSLFFQALKVSERQRSKYDSSLGVTPQLSIIWKWPLVLSSDLMTTIFTPILGTIIASNKESVDIFEEPSTEISDINFMDGHKSISSYSSDSGKRICYGFKLAGYKNGENLYRFTVGRSMELTSPPDRLEATGLKYKNSDIVSSLDVFLSDEWTFIANGSYFPHSKRWTRIESGLNFSDKKVCFDVMMFKGKQCLYNNPFTTESNPIAEEQKTQKYRGIMLDAGWYVSGTVRLKGGIVMGNDSTTPTALNGEKKGKYHLVKRNVGIEYKNECTTVDFLIERRNYRGGDLKPETALQLVVHLRNLGI